MVFEIKCSSEASFPYQKLFNNNLNSVRCFMTCELMLGKIQFSYQNCCQLRKKEKNYKKGGAEDLFALNKKLPEALKKLSMTVYNGQQQ